MTKCSCRFLMCPAAAVEVGSIWRKEENLAAVLFKDPHHLPSRIPAHTPKPITRPPGTCFKATTSEVSFPTHPLCSLLHIEDSAEVMDSSAFANPFPFFCVWKLHLDSKTRSVAFDEEVWWDCVVWFTGQDSRQVFTWICPLPFYRSFCGQEDKFRNTIKQYVYFSLSRCISPSLF